MMVYTGRGLTYTELKGMDMAEYREAVEVPVDRKRDDILVLTHIV